MGMRGCFLFDDIVFLVILISCKMKEFKFPNECQLFFSSCWWQKPEHRKGWKKYISHVHVFIFKKMLIRSAYKCIFQNFLGISYVMDVHYFLQWNMFDNIMSNGPACWDPAFAGIRLSDGPGLLWPGWGDVGWYVANPLCCINVLSTRLRCQFFK